MMTTLRIRDYEIIHERALAPCETPANSSRARRCFGCGVRDDTVLRSAILKHYYCWSCYASVWKVLARVSG